MPTATTASHMVAAKALRNNAGATNVTTRIRKSVVRTALSAGTTKNANREAAAHLVKSSAEAVAATTRTLIYAAHPPARDVQRATTV